MIQMYTNHFGPNTVETTADADGFSAYAGRTDTGDGTVVMVLNKNALRSEQALVIGGAGVDVETVHIFPAYSLSAVTVTDAGEVSITTYDEARQEDGPVEVL